MVLDFQQVHGDLAILAVQVFSEPFVSVTFRAALPNMKTPLILRTCVLPAMLSLGCFSFLQTWDVGVLHLREGFTHRLFQRHRSGFSMLMFLLVFL